MKLLSAFFLLFALIDAGATEPTATQPKVVFQTVVKSEYYIVRANVPEAEAKRIAAMLDSTHRRYLSFFVCESLHVIPVDVYRSRAEYEAIHPRLAGTEAAFSTGGFAWWKQTIDAFLDAELEGNLRHEVAHQFVHDVCSLDVEKSSGLRRLFGLPDYVERVPSVPSWVHEGIAQYLEVSDEPMVIPWHINKTRLIQLQKQLRDGTMSVRKLLAAKYVLGEFPGECYPAAWGIVYFLMNDKKNETEEKKRQLLRRYMDACTDPLRNYALAKKAEEVSGFWLQSWNTAVNAYGIVSFEARIADAFGGMDAFETVWREWILSLDPEDDYGGLRWKYQRVVSVSPDLDKITYKTGRSLYCTILAESPRGIVALVNSEQVHIPKQEVASVERTRHISNRQFFALVLKEANQQLSGPGDPNKIVGRKEFQGDAKLPGKEAAKKP